MHQKELTVGHLLSEGVIHSIGEIQEIRLKKGEVCQIKLKSSVSLEKRLKLLRPPFSRVILSACGNSKPYQYSEKLPKITSNLKVKAETILKSVRNLNSVAETFRKTGGVHVAALYEKSGNLLAFAEDVGRHNAVDKLIGISALDRVDFSQCFLTLSGRLTGDIVLKAAKVGIPIVASLAAAVDSGITIAKKTNLTLIGFVRGKRMNIYNLQERILS